MSPEEPEVVVRTVRQSLPLVSYPVTVGTHAPCDTSRDGGSLPSAAVGAAPVGGPELDAAQLTQINRALTQAVLQRDRAIGEQLEELRRWYRAAVACELRQLDLKKEVNELLARLGQPPRYASDAASEER